MGFDRQQYMVEYRKENREKILQKRREHYNKNKEHLLQQKKEIYNPNKAKHQRLVREYGITLEDYNERVEIQQHRCACCGDSAKLVVDHCHTNGNVRDLLCNRCNTVVGMVKEDVSVVENIKDYITKWTKQNLNNVRKV